VVCIGCIPRPWGIEPRTSIMLSRKRPASHGPTNPGAAGGLITWRIQCSQPAESLRREGLNTGVPGGPAPLLGPADAASLVDSIGASASGRSST